jgi:type VI secretion system secreted protein Hcp
MLALALTGTQNRSAETRLETTPLAAGGPIGTVKVGPITGGERSLAKIPITDIDWSVKNATVVSGGGAGGGKATFSPITILKRVDAATPKLALMVATGEHVPQPVIVEIFKPGTKQPYIKLTLETVVISSVRQSSATQESVSFNYGQITWEYRPTSGTPITRCFEIVAYTPC